MFVVDQNQVIHTPQPSNLVMVTFSWLFFLLIVAATMGVTLIVKIQVLADWTGCKVGQWWHD